MRLDPGQPQQKQTQQKHSAETPWHGTWLGWDSSLGLAVSWEGVEDSCKFPRWTQPVSAVHHSNLLSQAVTASWFFQPAPSCMHYLFSTWRRDLCRWQLPEYWLSRHFKTKLRFNYWLLKWNVIWSFILCYWDITDIIGLSILHRGVLFLPCHLLRQPTSEFFLGQELRLLQYVGTPQLPIKQLIR